MKFQGTIIVDFDAKDHREALKRLKKFSEIIQNELKLPVPYIDLEEVEDEEEDEVSF